ncbi:uncharacterized protein DS421_16g560690 [Arachis hypogaea]|nr:uncharacterized protein DS421_16g560690 [Arachis hypogaea]
MRWLIEVPTAAVAGGGWTDDQELEDGVSRFTIQPVRPNQPVLIRFNGYPAVLSPTVITGRSDRVLNRFAVKPVLPVCPGQFSEP